MRRTLAWAVPLCLVALVALGANIGPGGRIGPGSGGGGAAAGIIPEAAAQVATPVSGFAAIWSSTGDALLHWVDDGGTDHTLAEVVSDGGAVAQSFYNYNDGYTAINTHNICMDWGVTRTPTQCRSTSTAAEFHRFLFASPEPFAFHRLTITLSAVTVPGNWTAGQFMSWRLIACTTYPTIPDAVVAGCSVVDTIVFENGGTTAYGTGRNAINCATLPCTGSIVTNGNGLSPAGTTSFVAGDVKIWYLATRADDTPDYWTTTAIANMQAIITILN